MPATRFSCFTLKRKIRVVIFRLESQQQMGFGRSLAAGVPQGASTIAD
jgi:hypothetical protein